MAKFEAHMAKFEGAELQQKGPMLKDRKESYNVVPWQMLFLYKWQSLQALVRQLIWSHKI